MRNDTIGATLKHYIGVEPWAEIGSQLAFMLQRPLSSWPAGISSYFSGNGWKLANMAVKTSAVGSRHTFCMSCRSIEVRELGQCGLPFVMHCDKCYTDIELSLGVLAANYHLTANLLVLYYIATVSQREEFWKFMLMLDERKKDGK